MTTAEHGILQQPMSRRSCRQSSIFMALNEGSHVCWYCPHDSLTQFVCLAYFQWVCVTKPFHCVWSFLFINNPCFTAFPTTKLGCMPNSHVVSITPHHFSSLLAHELYKLLYYYAISFLFVF